MNVDGGNESDVSGVTKMKREHCLSVDNICATVSLRRGVCTVQRGFTPLFLISSHDTDVTLSITHLRSHFLINPSGHVIALFFPAAVVCPTSLSP